MKTYSATPTDITRKWYVLDASETPLGRVSTRAAKLLVGKEKTIFTKHIDCGDYVIVVNAAALIATGNKMNTKVYYRHTGFPGGIKSKTLKEVMQDDPAKVLYDAIRGMLPVNKLRAERLKRLKIYATAEHEHEAQKPTTLVVKESRK